MVEQLEVLEIGVLDIEVFGIEVIGMEFRIVGLDFLYICTS